MRARKTARPKKRTLAGRYHLRRLVGSGGMGAVWESEDDTLHRRVAVKVLSDSLAVQPEARERFGREARATARLHHPGIASVFDFGEDDDLPFIVMEFVEGKTLADVSKPVDPAEGARIGSEVAAALEAAHQEGIVHRDVKPSNVMLTPSGRVKVMDFGIAVAGWLPSVTTENALVGTPTYTSPEQAAGNKATPASDVYSLGVLLYELLAGSPPFTGDAPIAIANAHATAPPPPLPRTVPETLSATVAKTLAKDPADRPSAAELERTLNGGDAAEAPSTAVLPLAGDATIPLAAASATPEPPSSDLPSPSRAAGSSRKRSRWVAAGLAAILVVALIFAVATAGGGPETAAQGQPSGAADSVKVPDLVDMDRKSAKQTLVDNGLEMGRRIVTDGNDVVVATDPPAGSTLTKGSEVNLVLAAAAPEPEATPTVAPTEEPKAEEPKPEKEPEEPKPEKDNSGEGSSDSGQGDDEFVVPPGQEEDSSGSSD